VSTARVDFTRGAAERIARVVRIVEQGDRNQSGPTWGSVDSGSSGKVFRICTFTGSWATATLKTVTFKYQTNAPNTVEAMNLTMHLPDIGLTPPYYDCAVAKEGTAWYLVSAIEHNVKKGTFSAPWNKGETKTVTLVNGGSVTATNRHASVAGTGTKNCTVGRDEMEWELIAAEC